MIQVLNQIHHGSSNNWGNNIIQRNWQKSNAKSHPIVSPEEKVTLSSSQLWDHSPAFLSFQIKKTLKYHT